MAEAELNPTHLFISYATEDVVIAKWLARKLAALGYAVWFDQMKMLGGERTSEEIVTCARDWVENKFCANDKCRLRDRLWPGVNWSFHLVHGVVRDQAELEAIKSCGVTVIPFHRCLFDLCERYEIVEFSGSAGGDLAEVVRYYREKRALDEYR